MEKCTKYMQKMVADLVENSYSISVPIFKQFHKNIIGKGGANIKRFVKKATPRSTFQQRIAIQRPSSSQASEPTAKRPGAGFCLFRKTWPT